MLVIWGFVLHAPYWVAAITVGSAAFKGWAEK
jgi:hypothetical protein